LREPRFWEGRNGALGEAEHETRPHGRRLTLVRLCGLHQALAERWGKREERGTSQALHIYLVHGEEDYRDGPVPLLFLPWRDFTPLASPGPGNTYPFGFEHIYHSVFDQQAGIVPEAEGTCE
jgi:hypothetical protein